MSRFDPFGDLQTQGYLRNRFGTADPDHLKRLEHAAFADNVLTALQLLRKARSPRYEDLLETNRILFSSVYPWAGQDRLALAPGIAVGKAGQFDLFAHPKDIRRAVGHALELASDTDATRSRAGELLGYLAYAHPFLETNGRSIMTLHTDLTRRAGFHVAWQEVRKADFLAALTDELRRPGQALDSFLAPFIRRGGLDLTASASQLATNTGLNPGAAAPAGEQDKQPHSDRDRPLTPMAARHQVFREMMAEERAQSKRRKEEAPSIPPGSNQSYDPSP